MTPRSNSSRLSSAPPSPVLIQVSFFFLHQLKMFSCVHSQRPFQSHITRLTLSWTPENATRGIVIHLKHLCRGGGWGGGSNTSSRHFGFCCHKKEKKSLQQLLWKGTEPCPLHSANCIEIFNEVEKFDTH